MKPEYSTLSDKCILNYLKSGEIIIEPFNYKNLNTSSYDVTLGSYYYREQELNDDRPTNIYNIYSESMVKHVWGEPKEAKTYAHYKEKGIMLENIRDEEKIIFINPGETILAHTNEFIGGVNQVTTMMKARSSLGRNFIKTCSDAGWGDVGYFNRWTMEITNSSTKYRIPLVVGRRLAQIVFFDTDGIIDKTYDSDGKYQNHKTLEELMRNWKPSDMLPRMYNDYETKL